MKDFNIDNYLYTSKTLPKEYRGHKNVERLINIDKAMKDGHDRFIENVIVNIGDKIVITTITALMASIYNYINVLEK